MPYQNERERPIPHQNEEEIKDRFTFKSTAERFKKEAEQKQIQIDNLKSQLPNCKNDTERQYMEAQIQGLEQQKQESLRNYNTYMKFNEEAEKHYATNKAEIDKNKAMIKENDKEHSMEHER